MEDTTSERQKSLEELLQDVEFECPGVTLNENVGVETTDVIVETTTNATQESFDTTAAQEVSVDTITTSLPDHRFIKKVITGKFGKKKGQNTISFMLLIGAHTYLPLHKFSSFLVRLIKTPTFHACMRCFLIRRGRVMMHCSQC